MIYKSSKLTLFRSVGYQIDTCLSFSLYLRYGFRSESEQTYRNMVKRQTLLICMRKIRTYVFPSSISQSQQ